MLLEELLNLALALLGFCRGKSETGVIGGFGIWLQGYGSAGHLVRREPRQQLVRENVRKSFNES